MSRFTAIMILVLITFLTIGAAVALAEVVAPDGSGNGAEEDDATCPMGVEGDEGTMREHHESMHGEGSWEDMPGPGASAEEMKQYHESIHGEGSWEDMPHHGSSPEEMQAHHESIHGEGSWEQAPCNTEEAATATI